MTVEYYGVVRAKNNDGKLLHRPDMDVKYGGRYNGLAASLPGIPNHPKKIDGRSDCSIRYVFDKESWDCEEYNGAALKFLESTGSVLTIKVLGCSTSPWCVEEIDSLRRENRIFRKFEPVNNNSTPAYLNMCENIRKAEKLLDKVKETPPPDSSEYWYVSTPEYREVSRLKDFRAKVKDYLVTIQDLSRPRIKSEFILTRGSRKTSGEFYSSINSTDKGLIPNAYDILTSVTKYDPGCFDDFCDEFGYGHDSRKAEKTYQAVKKEFTELAMLYSDEEMSQLQEIQ